jgi:hypothetical protein
MTRIQIRADSWARVRQDTAENPALGIEVQGVGHEAYEFRLLMKDRKTGYTAEIAQQSSASPSFACRECGRECQKVAEIRVPTHPYCVFCSPECVCHYEARIAR